MVHSLADLSRHRYLDPVKFADFVQTYQTKNLTDCGGITSWDVDEVISDYKFFIGDSEYMADRNTIIKAAIL